MVKVTSCRFGGFVSTRIESLDMLTSIKLFGRTLCGTGSILLFVALAILVQVQIADSKSTIPEGQVPVVEDSALRSAAKTTVNKQYVDGLRAAANFKDYQVLCRMMTRKESKWKDFGAASIFFKQKELFRAVINSSDYRNGSVVVKEADGSIRGKGGGTLTFVKMTLQPDSRSIRLPTGYSLVESDFVSLYDSLKANIGKGGAAFASPAPVSFKPFKEPVMVLLLNAGPQPDSPISEVVFFDPRTKLPLVWNTYKDGEAHAVVLFEELQPNKGLSDDLFHL